MTHPLQRDATPPPTRAVALLFAEEPGRLPAAFYTLKYFKILTARREQGQMFPLPGRAKRNTAYRELTQPAKARDLLSEGLDNKSETA